MEDGSIADLDAPKYFYVQFDEEEHVIVNRWKYIVWDDREAYGSTYVITVMFDEIMDEPSFWNGIWVDWFILYMYV